MVKAVIFDLDDTLISEKQYVESGYHHIAAILSMQYRISKEKAFNDLMELFKESTKNVFNRVLDLYGICYTKQVILNLVDEYRNHFPDISFYDDVLTCLEQLKSRGIKTGIITDGYATAQRQKLKAVNAFAYFDEIIITDELGREHWKPHPKAFEIIRENLDVEFNEIMYVGDNPEKDFYISQIYPVKTVRVVREGVHQEKAYLKNISELHSLSGLNELPLLLTQYHL